MVSDPIDATAAAAWTAEFDRVVAAEWEALGRLDEHAGDGDFGRNIKGTLERARPRWSSDPAQAWAALSDEFFAAGGASGPLLGVWFRGWADGLAGGPLDLGGLTDAVREGTDTVARLGGAAPGDRTMLDAIVPALEALASGAELVAAISAAAVAARQGADATAAMVPKKGRATYLGERAVGQPDAGAAAVALWWEAGAGI